MSRHGENLKTYGKSEYLKMGLKCVCVLGRWIWCGSRRDCFKEGAGMTVRLQAPRGRTGSVDWKRLLNEERKEPRLGKGPGVVERKATWLGMEKTRNLSLFNGAPDGDEDACLL